MHLGCYCNYAILGSGTIRDLCERDRNYRLPMHKNNSLGGHTCQIWFEVHTSKKVSYNQSVLVRTRS